MSNTEKYSKLIKAEAARLGFCACGISEATHLEKESVVLKNWLKNEMQAGMHYMENHFEKRVDPTKLVDNAKSVISVLLNYYPGQVQQESYHRISKYAYGKDYHVIIKDKLFALLSYINTNLVKVKGRAFVDSAPVLDRAWAARSGLGWIGKNSCLINKSYGSFVFIGELIVDIKLQYDTSVKDYCGTCNSCIEACPTRAIVSPGIIDSRKCISYYTIEHKEEIPEKFRGKFENWIFGCDICQDVCPWNKKKATPTNEKQLIPSIDILNFSRESFEQLNEQSFNKTFNESTLIRTGYKRMKRNIDFVNQK